MSTDPRGRAWVDVSAPALLHNVASIREAVGSRTRVLPMVKADAYGLGMAGAVRVLEAADPWGFGVAAVSEGLRLRSLGCTRPVVVFSPVPPAEVDVAVEAGLALSVSDADTLSRLARRGGSARFHLEIDTGMGRAGFDPRRLDAWAPAVRAAVEAGAVWEGCFTHLHSADESAESVHRQIGIFQDVVRRLQPPADVLLHALNSAGALRCPEFAFDLVRPGIHLYGGRAGRDLPPPEAVVSVRARVVHVRRARAGDTVGYGSTHAARGDEVWATVAIGYGDGLPRALSNRGRALVRGCSVPIIGRISMDVTVVDISRVSDVAPGDAVTFLGRDGDEQITVDEVAEQVGTISYEILTGLTARLPRVWEDVGGS